jgi:Tfp pilus assembly protein PilO
MKIEMRPRDRRALIGLVAALVIYVLADRMVLPAYDQLTSAAESVQDKEIELKRYRRALLRKGQYGDLLKAAEDRLAVSESIVIPAETIPLASAGLQSLIEEAGASVGLMVSQRAVGSPRRLNDFYTEIPMTMSFDSTPGQLVAFLSELRSLPRFVNVRNLQLTPITQYTEAPKGIDVKKDIRVNLTVAALGPAALVKTEGTKR